NLVPHLALRQLHQARRERGTTLVRIQRLERKIVFDENPCLAESRAQQVDSFAVEGIVGLVKHDILPVVARCSSAQRYAKHSTHMPPRQDATPTDRSLARLRAFRCLGPKGGCAAHGPSLRRRTRRSVHRSALRGAKLTIS